jgi:hypothetical protein
VETPEINAIVIDYYWLAHDWMFIRNGKLIIHCNSTTNIELDPHESNTEVGVFGGTRVSESGFYSIITIRSPILNMNSLQSGDFKELWAI